MPIEFVSAFKGPTRKHTAIESIRFVVDEDATLEDLVQAFKQFVMGLGYTEATWAKVIAGENAETADGE